MGEYTCELLTRKEVKARYWDLRKENNHDRKWRNSRKRRNQGISGDYIFDMGSDVFIDGEDYDSSSWCRFANHSNLEDDATQRLEQEATKKRRQVVVTKKNSTKTAPKPYFRALVDIDHIFF
jgi:hypothetical protein